MFHQIVSPSLSRVINYCPHTPFFISRSARCVPISHYIFSLPLVEHVMLRAVLIPGFIHLFALFSPQNKRFQEVIFLTKESHYSLSFGPHLSSLGETQKRGGGCADISENSNAIFHLYDTHKCAFSAKQRPFSSGHVKVRLRVSPSAYVHVCQYEQQGGGCFTANGTVVFLPFVCF